MIPVAKMLDRLNGCKDNVGDASSAANSDTTVCSVEETTVLSMVPTSGASGPDSCSDSLDAAGFGEWA